jgi:hypothetical protein
MKERAIKTSWILQENFIELFKKQTTILGGAE